MILISDNNAGRVETICTYSTHDYNEQTLLNNLMGSAQEQIVGEIDYLSYYYNIIRLNIEKYFH